MIWKRILVFLLIIGMPLLALALVAYHEDLAVGTISEVERTKNLYGPVTVFKLTTQDLGPENPSRILYLGIEGHVLDIRNGDRACVEFYRWSAVARKGDTNYYKLKSCDVTSR